MSEKSILQKTVSFDNSRDIVDPRVTWRVGDFNELISAHGYDALLDRAMKCPCVDRSTSQALSTCRNCLGRGWFFVDRRHTVVVAQRMDNKKRYGEWGEINRGTASLTIVS